MTTRDRIESAAIQLFADQGVDGTAVRDIAQAAGVADGALYRHYKSKDELCQALFAKHYEAVGLLFMAQAAGQMGLAAKLAAIIDTAFDLFDRDRALFSFILLSQHDHLPAIPKTVTTPVEAVAGILADARQAGEIEISDITETVSLLFGLALQPAIFTIYGRLHGPLRARSQTVTRACCQILGIEPVTQKGPRP